MTGMSKVPEVVAEFASHVALTKGDVVFRANAPARHVFFLAQARVVLHRFGPAGEEVVIHVAQAGEFFAEASLPGSSACRSGAQQSGSGICC